MEHNRPDTAQSDLNDLKEQIALEYGRCLLQLQQFELMLKAALPTMKVSGFSDELVGNIERYRQFLVGKTLGHFGARELRWAMSKKLMMPYTTERTSASALVWKTGNG